MLLKEVVLFLESLWQQDRFLLQGVLQSNGKLVATALLTCRSPAELQPPRPNSFRESRPLQVEVMYKLLLQAIPREKSPLSASEEPPEVPPASLRTPKGTRRYHVQMFRTSVRG